MIVLKRQFGYTGNEQFDLAVSLLMAHYCTDRIKRDTAQGI